MLRGLLQSTAVRFRTMYVRNPFWKLHVFSIDGDTFIPGDVQFPLPVTTSRASPGELSNMLKHG
jgi:hypothetical protein